MKIFSRFKDSIINPKEIANFRFDPIGYVIFYFILLLLLAGLYVPIQMVSFDGLSNDMKDEIMTFTSELDPIQCDIINAQLDCAEEDFLVYGEYKGILIAFEHLDGELPIERTPAASFIFTETGIEVLASGMYTAFIEYSELPAYFHSMDLRNLNDISNTPFWLEFFDEVDQLLVANKGVIATASIISNYVLTFILIGMNLLVLSILIKFLSYRVKISLIESFKIVTYSLTVYTIIMFTAGLMGVIIPQIIEVLVIIIYIQIALSNVKLVIIK